MFKTSGPIGFVISVHGLRTDLLSFLGGIVTSWKGPSHVDLAVVGCCLERCLSSGLMRRSPSVLKGSEGRLLGSSLTSSAYLFSSFFPSLVASFFPPS